MTSRAASWIPGASQAPGSALVVEHAQERRRANDGKWYTEEEFRKFYWKPHGRFSVWGWYWKRAAREAVLPCASQPDSSAVAGRRPAERRQVDNGWWYTEDEIKKWRYWSRAEREAAAPGISFSDARIPDTKLTNALRCLGIDVFSKLDSGGSIPHRGQQISLGHGQGFSQDCGDISRRSHMVGIIPRGG